MVQIQKLYAELCVSASDACFQRERSQLSSDLRKGLRTTASQGAAISLRLLTTGSECAGLEQVLVQQGPLPGQAQDCLQGEEIVEFTSMSCPKSKGEVPLRYTIMATNTSWDTGWH